MKGRKGFEGIHRLFAQGMLIAGLALVGLAQADDADWPNYDTTVNYICDSCTDWSAATNFVNHHAIAKPCGDGSGSGAGGGDDSGGDDDAGGSGDPGGGSGGGIDPFSIASTSCNAPDERANVLNPATGNIYTFIIERQSQAQDGAPPIVYPYPEAISSEEKSDLEWAMDVYVRYRSLEEDLTDYISDWLSETASREALHHFTRNDSDDRLCATGTALDTLSDRSKLLELREKAIDWLADEYDSRLPDGAQVRVNQGGVQIFGTGVNVAVEHVNPEEIGGWRSNFEIRNCAECSHGWQYISHDPDFLRFTFDITLDHSGNSIVVNPNLSFDPHGSRINHTNGWLTEGGHESVEDMDECDLKQLREAFERGIIGTKANPPIGTVGGGWVGGFFWGQADNGSGYTTWICQGTTCCSSSACLPRSIVEDLPKPGDDQN